MEFEEILKIEPYSLPKAEKEVLLTERLKELTDMHSEKCPEYRKMLYSTGYDKERIMSYKDIPFIPVRLFKELSLKSVDDENVVKTMTSSGTSGQAVSKIYLNRDTASNQQKTMVKIVNDFTGSARLPMIIIDCPSVVKDRKMFSARGAGILGFSMFGSKKIYALDDEMKLDVSGVTAFLNEHKGEKILLFGFTFMIWQYFYKELLKLKDDGIEFDLSNGILIHGGGWKKLISEAVSPEEFHDDLKKICGLDRIHDYYGMVEQTGCIYMQCECGHLHASVFSDVIARRYTDFSECGIGEKGILQVVSTIPESYPGHSLLTEDEGVILGEDDCPCGRKGKYFKVLGRLKDAEIRGCSDTFSVRRTNNISSKVDTLDDSQSISSKDAIKDVFSRIDYLFGNSDLIANMSGLSPLEPFSDGIVDFLNDLSGAFMKDPVAHAFPDIVTLGFWLRKSNVIKMKEKSVCRDRIRRIGRGMAFHIAPSNVPVNFAYTLFSGLICGNSNIVRIPSKEFAQVGIIVDIINRVLKDHEDVKPYIALVRYERDKRINDVLSSLCDVRIIWGGDATIEDIRRSPLNARATEITFADRYSLAVIDSDEYLKRAEEEKNRSRIANDFYNDTYLSDQNACTSPRVVVWMGEHKNEARKLFWNSLNSVVEDKYGFYPIQSIDKLDTFYKAAASGITSLKLEENRSGNKLVCVKVDRLESGLMKYRGNSGLFYEYEADDIFKIRDFCNDTRCQTVGLLGKKELIDPLLDSGIRGVDRIADIGHTMDFDLVWDGYDLVERLTRSISG